MSEGRPAFGKGPFLRGLWYVAASAGEVGRGRTLGKTLLGEPVLLGRTEEGEPFALRDMCPHRGMPLRFGAFDGAEITCCYHGWTFEPGGRCTGVPALAGDAEIEVERIRVRSFPCREVQGNLWVYFDDEREGPEPPPVPRVSFGDDARPAFAATVPFPCHADHAVYALMDPAHVAHVHTSSWWSRAKTLREKEKRFEPAPLGWRMARHAVPSTSRLYRLLGRDVTSELLYQLPGLRLEEIRGDRHSVVSFTFVTPVDAESSEVHQCIYATMGWARALRPLGEKMVRVFLNQDRDITVRQREGLQHDPPLMFLGDPDMQPRWLERLRREWVGARSEGRAFENPLEPRTLRWRS